MLEKIVAFGELRTFPFHAEPEVAVHIRTSSTALDHFFQVFNHIDLMLLAVDNQGLIIEFEEK